MNCKHILVSLVFFFLIVTPVLAEQKPVAVFTAVPTSGNAPLIVYFNDTSTGQNVRYDWDFGDGGTYRSRYAVHTYTKTGTYNATLKVSNGAGISTFSQKIIIPAYDPATVAPRAFISALNPSGKSPYTVYFMDQSRGNPTARMWVFGDGFFSTEINPAHTFTKAGRYRVTIREWNSKGYSAGKLPNNVVIT